MWLGRVFAVQPNILPGEFLYCKTVRVFRNDRENEFVSFRMISVAKWFQKFNELWTPVLLQEIPGFDELSHSKKLLSLECRFLKGLPQERGWGELSKLTVLPQE